jgi:UPF0716 protein FxsA
VGRFLLLFALLVAVEMSLLVWLGEVLGPWPVLGIVLGTAFLGTSLAKREGLRVMVLYRETVALGRIPEEGLMGAALVALAGVLLVLPGVLSDLTGLLLLFPPTRRMIEKRVRRRMSRGMQPAAGAPVEPGREGDPWREAARRRRARTAESDAELVDDTDST